MGFLVRRISRWIAFHTVIVLTANLPAGQSTDAYFEQGDRVCIVGNTLADRLQHHGWLETLIQARFPTKNLVFRNLGFSGDETLRQGEAFRV